MNTLSTLFLSTLLVLSPLLSTAIAESAIATVDVNRILNESPDAKTRKKALDEKAAALKATIETKRAALIEGEKKLKEQKVSDTSPEAEKLRAQARDFERFVRDSDEDLKKEFLKVNKELTDRVLKLVEAYAKEKKILLVLDKGEKARGAVLYGDSSNDITDEILKREK